MPHPIEIREKAIRQYIAGYTEDQICANLGVSKWAIRNWKKLLLTTGSLEKKKVERRSGIPYKYKPEKLQALLDQGRSSETTLTFVGSGEAVDTPMIKDCKESKVKGKKKKKKNKKD